MSERLRKQWVRICEILDLVEALPQSEQSDAIAEHCGDDFDLRELVIEQMNAAARTKGFFDRSSPGVALQRAMATADSAQNSDSIGPFRIIEEIGRGGMGVVYKAEQDHPRRFVALKVIRASAFTQDMVRRFRIEADALGRLQHPGIAQIFEADTDETPDGVQPYFAMEYIEGAMLTDYAKQRKLGARDRLRLMGQICEAVHYAHQKGVIHRDMKPANVLVDPQGQPKILDFGVARIAGPDVPERTLRTDVGQLIGTLQYMSPEQAGGNPADIDIRSDVYALGVLCYELLVDRHPVDVGDKTVPDAIRMIREHPPRRLRSLDRSFDEDVDIIVNKALQKEPQERYQSASELAADLERYLAGEPIDAREPSVLYQLRLLGRRHRIKMGIAVGFLLLIVSSVLALAWLYTSSETHRRTAIWTSYRANITTANFALRTKDGVTAQAALATAPPEYRGWEWSYLNAVSDKSLATFAATDVRDAPWGPNMLARSPDNCWLAWPSHREGVHVLRVLAMSDDARSLDALRAAPPREILLPNYEENPVFAIAFSYNSRWMATGSELGEMHLWEVGEFDSPHTLKEATDTFDCINAVGFSSDHLYVGAVFGSGAVRLWDVTTRTEMAVGMHEDIVWNLVFHPTLPLVATTSWDGTCRIWRIPDLEPVATLRHDESFVYDACFVPHRPLLVTASADGIVRLWDVNTWQWLDSGAMPGHGDGVKSLAISGDGSLLAVGTANGAIRLWNVAGEVPRSVATFGGHIDRIWHLCFSPNGSRLYSGSHDRTVSIWDTRIGTHIATYIAHETEVLGLSIDPSGTTLASLSRHGTLKIWDADPPATTVSLEGATCHSMPRGDSVGAGVVAALCFDASAVHVFDSRSGQLLAHLPSGDTPFVDVTIDRTGAYAITSQADGVISIWNIANAQRLRTVKAGLYVHPFTRNGQDFIAAIGTDGIAILDIMLKSRATIQASPCQLSGCTTVSEDGRRLACLIANQGGVLVLDPLEPSSVVASPVPRSVGEYRSVTLSPDGQIMLIDGREEILQVWDAGSLTLTCEIHTGTYPSTKVAIHPGGDRIAVVTDSVFLSQVITIWHIARREPLLALEVACGSIEYLKFSPDGTQLHAISEDGVITTFDSVAYGEGYAEGTRSSDAGE